MSEQTTDATSRALDMVEKFAGKLTETVQQYGPDATSLALEVGRVSAIQAVAVPAAVLLVVVPLGYYCVRLIIWGI